MSIKNKHLSDDQLIALLEIYESEWQHRNNLLWSQVFKLFYFSIFIITIPILSDGLGFNMPKVSRLVFPVSGFLAASFSYYMAIGYALRLRVTRDSLNNLIKLLPPQYRLLRLSKLKYGKYFMKRQTIIIPTVIFCVEVIVAIVVFYCINKGLLTT